MIQGIPPEAFTAEPINLAIIAGIVVALVIFALIWKVLGPMIAHLLKRTNGNGNGKALDLADKLIEHEGRFIDGLDRLADQVADLNSIMATYLVELPAQLAGLESRILEAIRSGHTNGN